MSIIHNKDHTQVVLYEVSQLEVGYISCTAMYNSYHSLDSLVVFVPLEVVLGGS